MNGPQHYQEAQRLLCQSVEMTHQAAAEPELADQDFRLRLADALVARAQVHATLALAAAQYDGFVGGLVEDVGRFPQYDPPCPHGGRHGHVAPAAAPAAAATGPIGPEA